MSLATPLAAVRRDGRTHLRAGEWVSTGIASGMLAPRPGQGVTLRFGTLPGFTLNFG
jgi:2-keto-4-pentenoate hydratase